MRQSIPAITIWQPWASLIAAGGKRFEFRSWPAPSRYLNQRVAIHAGARPVRVSEIRDLLAKLQSPHAAETGVDPAIAIPLLERALNAPKAMPLSSVVCTARLGRPIRNAELGRELGIALPMNDSDRDEHSNWGWPLTEIRVLEPFVPARGSQGWWWWTPPAEDSHG